MRLLQNMISSYKNQHMCNFRLVRIMFSGGSRNLERGVQQLAHETHPKKVRVATPTSGTLMLHRHA